MAWTPVPTPLHPRTTHTIDVTDKNAIEMDVPTPNGHLISGANIIVRGTNGRAGIMHQSEAIKPIVRPAHEHHDDTVMGCRFRAFPRYNIKKKWPRRGYGFTGVSKVERCWWQGFCEHWYDTPRSGTLSYIDNWADNMGGQGLQLRLSGNAADEDWNNPKRIVIIRQVITECGQEWGAGRAGFSLSVKTMGPETDVLVIDPFIQTINQLHVKKASTGQWADSFGSACFEFCRSLEIQGGVFEMLNPANDFQFYDMAEKRPDMCAPQNIKWLVPAKSINHDIHLRVGATLKCDIAPIASQRDFVLHGMNQFGVWNKIVDRVPMIQGVHW